VNALALELPATERSALLETSAVSVGGATALRRPVRLPGGTAAVDIEPKVFIGATGVGATAIRVGERLPTALDCPVASRSLARFSVIFAALIHAREAACQGTLYPVPAGKVADHGASQPIF
jgi:hypothetical protein